MVNYTNGKIYLIRPTIDHEEEDEYIGSTTYTLDKRFGGHQSGCARWKNGEAKLCTSYLLFEKYGMDNCEIILLEDYPCTCVEELRERETYYYNTRKCINKIAPLRTKDEIRLYKQQYAQDHKEHIQQYKKDYYKENKDEIQQKYHEFYFKNRNTILEYNKQYRDENREHVSQLRKLSYKKNREVILAKQKEYASKNKERKSEYDRKRREQKKLAKQAEAPLI